MLLIPIVHYLPSLRLNSLKRIIYNLAGHKLDRGVKIASSAKIIGAFTAFIGKNTFIGHETMIVGGNSDIYIGKNCDISSRVNLVMGSHEIAVESDRSAGIGFSKSIIIEDGVWIGFGATVLPGVKIGKNSIIGAGSLVNKTIPPYTIAAGNPCKIIKQYNQTTGQWTSA